MSLIIIFERGTNVSPVMYTAIDFESPWTLEVRLELKGLRYTLVKLYTLCRDSKPKGQKLTIAKIGKCLHL
jgi:hypothetical protein